MVILFDTKRREKTHIVIRKVVKKGILCLKDTVTTGIQKKDRETF